MKQYHVLPKYYKVLNFDDPRHIVRVVLADSRQDFNLYLCLSRIFLFVLDNLQGQVLVLLVVEHLVDLAIGSLSQILDQLVAIGYMVLEFTLVLEADLVDDYSSLSYEEPYRWISSRFLSLWPM